MQDLASGIPYTRADSCTSGYADWVAESLSGSLGSNDSISQAAGSDLGAKLGTEASQADVLGGRVAGLSP